MILLEEINTEFGHIKIIRSKSDGTCTYYQDECLHSKINAEGVSICGYVHVMYSIIRQSGAKNILMIGCAGGTLATLLHRLGCKVTVVDINPVAFTLAQKYFQMPQEIECVVGDGWSYLLKTPKRYGAIAVDAFNSNGTVPKEFTTEEFFAVVKKVLKSFGVVAMNIVVEHDIDLLADRVALNMESVKIPARLFDWPGRINRNTIVAGGTVEQMQISSHEKPTFVKREMQGIVRRTAKKRAADRNK